MRAAVYGHEVYELMRYCGWTVNDIAALTYTERFIAIAVLRGDP